MDICSFAASLKFVSGLVADLVKNVGDHNLAAGIEESLNYRTTDSARTAGDERDFTR